MSGDGLAPRVMSECALGILALAAACTSPSEGSVLPELPVESPVREPESAGHEAPAIRRLALCYDRIVALTERGLGYRGFAPFGPWLADQHSIEALWQDPGALCVRAASGVSCTLWGPNPFAAYPNADGAERSELRFELPTQAAVLDLDWSFRSLCAVTSEGATWCGWGEGPIPLRPFPVSGARDIELQDDFGCALLEDRSAVCWLGTKLTMAKFCEQTPDAPGCPELQAHPEMSDWPAPSDRFADARDIAVGDRYACILDEAGVPRCCDTRRFAMSSVGKSDEFARIEGMPALVEIDGGNEHVCGRSDEGEIWCWGANEFGQLGDGTTQSQRVATPVRAGSFPALDQLVLGYDESCVLVEDRVHCWGHRFDTPLDSIPTEILGVRASALVIDESGGCALGDEGWMCWGGESHTLGGVAAASRVVAREPSDVFFEGCRVRAGELRCVDDDETWLRLRGVIDVSPIGIDHLCVLRDKEVQCHEYGGDPPRVVRVPASVSVQGEWDDGCVLTRAGEVHCWTAEQNAKPLALPTKQLQLAMSFFDACFLDEGGAVRCRALEGEPPAIAAVSDVVELRAGARQVCARTRMGELACWGESLVPVDLDSPSFAQPIWLELPAPALEFRLGVDFGCARLDDGRVACWGDEMNGQRGRLSAEFVTRPTQVEVPLLGPPPARG